MSEISHDLISKIKISGEIPNERDMLSEVICGNHETSQKRTVSYQGQGKVGFLLDCGCIMHCKGDNVTFEKK